MVRSLVPIGRSWRCSVINRIYLFNIFPVLNRLGLLKEIFSDTVSMGDASTSAALSAGMTSRD